MRTLLLSSFLLASLSACTWVKLEPGGKEVRVARASDDLSVCTKRGEVAVTVRDNVSLYQRNELKVRDELETLARNEATGLAADTLQALNQPVDGEQRFAAYSCGGRAPVARAPSPAPSAASRDASEAQTYPLRDE
jgi:hypothetical protein